MVQRCLPEDSDRFPLGYNRSARRPEECPESSFAIVTFGSPSHAPGIADSEKVRRYVAEKAARI
jgi:hypothetical protein